MAVSGIDHTIKIFSPDARDQRNARKGVGVQSTDPGSFSSLNWGRQRRTQSTNNESERQAEDLSDSDEEVAMNGLRSRKRMHDAYQITSQNDMDRKGGREDYFISVSVLLIGRSIVADHRNSKRFLRSWLDILPHSKAVVVEGMTIVPLLLQRRTAPSCRSPARHVTSSPALIVPAQPDDLYLEYTGCITILL
jgi:hypothetical protein